MKDTGQFNHIVSAVRCPRCSAAPGEHCKTAPPPGRRIFPPHEQRREAAAKSSGALIVEGTQTGRFSSSKENRSNTPQHDEPLRMPVMNEKRIKREAAQAAKRSEQRRADERKKAKEQEREQRERDEVIERQSKELDAILAKDPNALMPKEAR